MAAFARPALAGLVAGLLSATAAAAGPVLDAIAERGGIRLGVRSDAPPFSSIVDGTAQGFTVALCGAVAGALKEELGAERFNATLVPVGTAERFETLARGEIDLLCGATTVTLTRRAEVEFSIPVFLTGVGAVIAADAPPLLRAVLVEDGPAALSQTIVTEALKGTRLGVRADTTAGTWLSGPALEGVPEVEIAEFDSHEAGIAQVESGELDAYLADHAILTALTRGREGLAISQKAFTHEPYALAMPRGDAQLRLSVDRALSRLYRSGRVLALFERSFGPPNAAVRAFYANAAIPE